MTVEPCRTGSAPRWLYVHCHRGGIGCPLRHEDDPQQMRHETRVFGPRTSIVSLLRWYWYLLRGGER